MGKVLQNVIKERKKKKDTKIKEIEKKKDEEELRHQLETQTIVSSLSKWLTKKASEMIKKNAKSGLLQSLKQKRPN